MGRWYKTLVENNSDYTLLSRQNRSIFIRDDSSQLKVMEMHQDLDGPYIFWVKTPKGMISDLKNDDKVWIPITCLEISNMN